MYALSEDIDEIEALTPGQFLIGGPLLAPPDKGDYSGNIHQRWHVVQKMMQDFWKKWNRDYIHTLQQRSKWKTSSKNLERASPHKRR